MTTIIATRDRMLSDGQVTNGDMIGQENFKKIRKVENYILGGCGRLTSVLRFFELFEQKIRMDSVQALVPHVMLTIEGEESKSPDEYFEALVLHPDGRIFRYEDNTFTRYQEIEEDYCSIGSGSTYALPVLDSGAGPEIAIEIAKKRDIYSGGSTFIEYLNSSEEENTEEQLSQLSKEDLVSLLLQKG